MNRYLYIPLLFLYVQSTAYAGPEMEAVSETTSSGESAVQGDSPEHQKLFGKFFHTFDRAPEDISKIHEMAENGHPTASAIAAELLLHSLDTDAQNVAHLAGNIDSNAVQEKIQEYLGRGLESQDPYANYVVGKMLYAAHKFYENSGEQVPSQHQDILQQAYHYLSAAKQGSISKAHHFLEEIEGLLGMRTTAEGPTVEPATSTEAAS
jgi:hypothetical protein